MQKSFCNTHLNEEEKYLCSHSTCVKTESNRLLCLECFADHKKGRSKFHKKISILAIKDQAKNNLEQYLKLQESIIQKCEEYSKQCEKSFNEQLKSLNDWVEVQLKAIKNSKEQQIAILKQNIEKAKQLYQTSKLDSLIYFFKLNTDDEKEFFEEFQYESERQQKFQILEIANKCLSLTSKSFNMQNIFSAKKNEFKIPVDSPEDEKYGKCDLHQAKKVFISIHRNSYNKETIKLNCLGCLQKDHHEDGCDKQACIKKITQILEEQNLKKKKLIAESKKLQKQVKQQIDQQLETILENKIKNEEFYESQKEQFKILEKEALNQQIRTKQSEYVSGIDYDLLYQTDQIIEAQFKLDFAGVLKKINIIGAQKPLQQKLFLEVDQETKRLKELQNEQQMKIDVLTEKLNKQESQLKSQSLESLVQAINSIKEQIQRKQ